MLQFDENWSSYNQFIAYREEIKRRNLRFPNRLPAALQRAGTRSRDGRGTGSIMVA